MNDDTLLRQALRDTVEPVLADPVALLDHATRAGATIRRRRHAGAVLAGAACIGVVAGAVALGQSLRAPESTSLPIASDPTASPSESPSEQAPVKGDPQGLAPVVLQLDGWTCEVFLEDDKEWCQGPGSAAASINWRAAAERAAFLDKYEGAHTTTPMLGGTGDVFAGEPVAIGPVQGEWFISVHGGGLSLDELSEVAGALSWQ